MWHKSRLLSSPDSIKTKHLKPQQSLYGSWVDFSLQFSKAKRSFPAYETNVQICEKKSISIKKIYIILVVVLKCYFGLHWFELNVFSAIFFGSATFNMPNLLIFLFCVFYTVESYGFSIETWTWANFFTDIDHFMKLVQFPFESQCSDWIGIQVQV